MQRLSKSLFDLSVFHKWRGHLNNLFLFQSFFHVEYLRTHMMLHSGDQAGNSIFSCPNAPNCTKVCSTFSFSIFLTQRHLIDNNIFLFNYVQRFKVKSSIRLHYLHCQAKKPIPIEEDNSETEKESPPAKRQRTNDLSTAFPLQPSDR